MQFVLKLANQQIFYDQKNIFIDDNVCATYDNNSVIWLADGSVLAKFNHYSDHSWIIAKGYADGILEAHDRDKLLRNQSYNKIIGTYTGPHAGALASYIAYSYFLTTDDAKKSASAIKTVRQKAITTEKQSPNSEKTIQGEKEKLPEPNIQQEIQREPELKYIPPKQEVPKTEKRYEEPPVYEPPKQEYEYKKPDFTPPPAPIPGGNSEENGGSGCLAIAIAIVVLIIAIKLIPQSWKELPTYLSDGDIGITICFFSSLIGGVVAVFRCIYDKECKLSSALSTFLITCGVGIAINAFILFKDIFAGDYEFTGFILFDLPLAIFAPMLGCFQFAFPIGIGVIIICGIICLIKKNS